MTTPSADRRVWLITGATSGFGRSLTGEVLRQGDLVVAAARGVSRLDDLKGTYPDLLFRVTLDVTDTARDAEVVDETAERFGRVDVLVNNAGRTQVGALEETTDAEMRFLFELHYFGPTALTKAVLPHMRRQGGGWVVQFSSVGGQVTAPGFYRACGPPPDSVARLGWGPWTRCPRLRDRSGRMVGRVCLCPGPATGGVIS